MATHAGKAHTNGAWLDQQANQFINITRCQINNWSLIYILRKCLVELSHIYVVAMI